MNANLGWSALISYATEELPIGLAKRVREPVLMICVILNDYGEL